MKTYLDTLEGSDPLNIEPNLLSNSIRALIEDSLTVVFSGILSKEMECHQEVIYVHPLPPLLAHSLDVVLQQILPQSSIDDRMRSKSSGEAALICLSDHTRLPLEIVSDEIETFFHDLVGREDGQSLRRHPASNASSRISLTR